MTCIVTDWPSKKALRESAQAEGSLAKFYFTEPTPWVDRVKPFSHMAVGETIVATNHPKRSWFASITRISETEWRVK